MLEIKELKRRERGRKMPKHAGPGPSLRRPGRAGFRIGLDLGRSGPASGIRPRLIVAVLVPVLALAPLPSRAQDSGAAPAGTPDIYVNSKLLERLAKERPSPAPSGAPQARPLLQAPPSWQLESRLYVVPLGQAGPAEPAQAPPAPSVLTSELEALEGRRAGAGRKEAVVKPRAVPPRPETAKAEAAEAEPGPDDDAAPGASAAAPEEPEAATPPPPAADPGGAEPPAVPATAEPPDPAPAAAGPGAPPAPAAILGELAEAAERETPRPSKITAPPVPEPPTPSGQATAAAEASATAEAKAPTPPPPAAPPAPGPEERLGPAAPAVATPGDGAPQLTARPPAKAPQEGQILFEAGSTELSPEARSVLESLAARLLAADAEAIELRAYATGRDPRRLSLSRGLVARGYLEKLGVAADKVFLRPLGDKAAEGPAERIDYELVMP